MWLTLAHRGTVYTMPKIVRFHQVGGPEVLKLEELPAPKPQKGEVLIKVDAIGLNRVWSAQADLTRQIVKGSADRGGFQTTAMIVEQKAG